MIIQENISLKPYNTFQIDVKAKYFVEIKSEEELRQLFLSDIFKKEKRLIIGWGANLLFAKDFDGLVIHRVWKNWSNFVEECNKNWYAGLENLIWIPGNVETAPLSNIWAYGVEVWEMIESVEWYDLESLERKIFSRYECKFVYRTSIFKEKLRNKFIITKVNFKFSAGDPESLKAKSDEILALRNGKLPDPAVEPNAWSFFKNPFVSIEKWKELKEENADLTWYEVDGMMKLSAWQLIELAGLKWYVDGKAGVSAKHALVLVNKWWTPDDMLNMMKKVQREVFDKFWVELEAEVVIV